MRKKYEEPSMQIAILQLEVVTLASGGEGTFTDPEGDEKDYEGVF